MGAPSPYGLCCSAVGPAVPHMIFWSFAEDDSFPRVLRALNDWDIRLDSWAQHAAHPTSSIRLQFEYFSLRLRGEKNPRSSACICGFIIRVPDAAHAIKIAPTGRLRYKIFRCMEVFPVSPRDPRGSIFPV